MLTERTTYFFGVSGSMLLHLFVVALALVLARPELERREFIRPDIIHARLVELEAQAPEPTEPEERVIDLTRRQIPQPAPPEPVASRNVPVEPEPEVNLEPEQPEPEAAQPELPAIAQREQDFTNQLQREAQAIAAQADRKQVASYSALIEQRAAANWSRPPSARRGMVVELRVNLLPTGRVVDVEVVSSSGDAAFDRSASQAVLKAQPFERIQELPSDIFEENFRTFRFRFSPDDLRL